MIDSTKTPVPLWKRYAMIAGLAIVVIVAVAFIYTKELHHGGSSTSSGSPAATTPAPTPPTSAHSAPSGPVGGIPVSSRNPFEQA